MKNPIPSEIHAMRRHLKRALLYAEASIAARESTAWNEPNVQAERKWLNKAKSHCYNLKGEPK